MKRDGPGGTPDSDDGPPREGNAVLTDGSGSYCAECHRSVAREDHVERAGEVYHRQCAPDDVVEHRTFDELRTDGGLDAETVIGTVDPGDVVVVAGSPYRVVDVEADEDDGVLRLYDLVERTETVKAAGAGDVDVYLHRSESDAIQTRVDQERERRDVQDGYDELDESNSGESFEDLNNESDDVDRGEGVETDGGIDWNFENVEAGEVRKLAEQKGLDEDGLRMHVDLAERIAWAVNEDDVDVREAQAAVESLADDLQDSAEVPDDWILKHRFGVVPAEDPGLVDRIVGWFR